MKHSPVLRITTPCACIACSVSTRNTLPNSLLDRSSVAAAAAAAEWCGVVRHSRTYVCTDARTHTDAQTHVRARTHVRTDGSTEARTHPCQEARPNHWPPTHTARRGVGGGQGYPSVPNNRQHGSQELQDEGDIDAPSSSNCMHAQSPMHTNVAALKWPAVASEDWLQCQAAGLAYTVDQSKFLRTSV